MKLISGRRIKGVWRKRYTTTNGNIIEIETDNQGNKVIKRLVKKCQV